MGGAPGIAANPKVLICDTDAILQLVIGDVIPCLVELKRRYGVQPMMVDRVSHELERHSEGRFRKYLGPIRKSRNVLEPVTRHSLARAGFDLSVTPALLDQIEAEGQRLSQVTDTGEAYSHAAANVLDGLIMSNDSTAIRELRNAGQRISSPILRSSDLMTFGLQIGALDLARCETARGLLMGAKEWMPECFLKTSFESGLGNYFQRLSDVGIPVRGAGGAKSGADVCVFLRELAAV